MSKDKSEVDEQRFVTPEFVARYVHLDEKREPQKDQEFAPYWGLAMVLPKEHPFWEEAEEKIQVALTNKFGNEPKKWRSPIKDGDEWEDEDFHGCYVMELKNSRRKPGIKVYNPDGANEDVVDYDEEVYSGITVVCTGRFGGYDKGSNGVGAYLNNVLKLEDGERLGGSSPSAEAEFEGFVRGKGSSKKSGKDKGNGEKKSKAGKKRPNPLD